MKRLLIAIVVSLCLLLLLPSMAAAAGISIVSKTGDGNWVGNNWQVELYPAETKTASVELYNSSVSDLAVEVSVVPEARDSGNVVFSVSDGAFTMASRSYAYVLLSVEASASTTPDTYSAEFELKFEQAPSGGGGGGGGGVGDLEITELKVSNVTETSADVTWKTNRGTTTELTYDDEAVSDNNSTKSHSVQLGGLEPCTEYRLKIVCEDRYGLRDTEYIAFKTLCPEPEPTQEPQPPETTPEPTPPATIPPTTEPEQEEPDPVSFPWGWSIVGVIAIIAVAAGIVFWWKRRA